MFYNEIILRMLQGIHRFLMNTGKSVLNRPENNKIK